MTRGPFIVLEGMVGCGKTTQLEVVRRIIEERGVSCVYGREPGGVPISEKIRVVLLDPENREMVPLTELFLFEAARAQFVAQRVRPQLESGRTFLTDRFYHSTVAFQGYGKGVPIDLIVRCNEDAVGGIHPDRTYILDVENIAYALRRARKASATIGEADRFEHEELAFHERVRDGYRNVTGLYKGVVLVPNFEEVEDVPARIERVSSFLREDLEKFLDGYFRA